jgi:predicted polyphosphate/ATP-dependent NAD kinase
VVARPIGIIANPASGKDIRRLVAHASTFDNGEKASIVRRALLGALAAGAEEFLYMPEPNGLVQGAVAEIKREVTLRAVESPETASALDTTRAATAMREAGCVAVIVLGGDGTNRAVVKGWRDAPLLSISTGTNNVFPLMLEGTIAGSAVGLLASGVVERDEVAWRAKAVTVEIDGERPDVALIDAVLVDSAFIGARALWEPATLRVLVLARAEPAAVGMSAIGGLLQPIGPDEDMGLAVTIGAGSGAIRAPIAPGLFATVPIASVRQLAFGEEVTVRGPGVLALDGERERQLKPGQEARLTVRRDGPWVIDPARTLRLGACRRAFREDSNGDEHGN